VNASLATRLQDSLRARGFLVSEGLAYDRGGFLRYSFTEPAVAKALAEAEALIVLGFHGALDDLLHEVAFFVANSRVDRTIILGQEEDFQESPRWISAAHRILVRSRANELIVPGINDDVIEEVCARVEQFPDRTEDLGIRNIFLSYSRTDADKARRKYEILKSIGCSVWFDKESLLPGQDWDQEIRRAVRGASLFMALLSSDGLKRRGFLHKELRLARDVIDEFPEGDIFVLPVLLDSGAQEFLPDWLRRFHWTEWGTDYVSKELWAAISISQAIGGRWYQP
jgi:hypothetical protein